MTPLADVPDDVRVIELREDLDLVREAVCGPLVALEEHLQRDGTIRLAVACLVDDTHPPRAGDLPDLEPTFETFSGRTGMARR